MQRSIYSRKSMPFELEKSIFLDRRCQFVDRLKWDLCVTPQGYEADEYDDDDSHYLIVHKNQKHMGSCRIRSTSCSTMVEDHFSDSFPEAKDFLRMQKGRICELTRFCRAPNISALESKGMLENLALLLDFYRDDSNYCGFAAVVFPHVARLLDTLGVRYLVVAKSQVGGRNALLICITHAVDVRTLPFHVETGEFVSPYQKRCDRAIFQSAA